MAPAGFETRLFHSQRIWLTLHYMATLGKNNRIFIKRPPMNHTSLRPHPFATCHCCLSHQEVESIPPSSLLFFFFLVSGITLWFTLIDYGWSDIVGVPEPRLQEALQLHSYHLGILRLPYAIDVQAVLEDERSCGAELRLSSPHPAPTASCSRPIWMSQLQLSSRCL